MYFGNVLNSMLTPLFAYPLTDLITIPFQRRYFAAI